ncbi:hypothetical protein B4082_5926 [Bacillus cereus]|uniref:Uncharacterized protein n=1 Tax=Bacillus cereus TaxID=1396 RepID=A0A164BE48_BACCE|nr:hypothetical protein B4082_5926 [Bacillus cereus]
MNIHSYSFKNTFFGMNVHSYNSIKLFLAPLLLIIRNECSFLSL